jgi:hypothetical protein
MEKLRLSPELWEQDAKTFYGEAPGSLLSGACDRSGNFAFGRTTPPLMNCPEKRFTVFSRIG